MKLRKIVAAYFSDLSEDIVSGKISDGCVKGLLRIIMLIEEHKEVKEENTFITDKEHNTDKENNNQDKEEMSPEECLACELALMLGISGLTEPGEFPMSSKPTIKIRIKKVSSQDDLNKILKELKNGGLLDLNTVNDKLGEIFDLNSILEILDTPMFKKGGPVKLSSLEPEDLAKMKAKYGILDEDILKGIKTFTVKGLEYRFINGVPTPILSSSSVGKKEEGGELTLREFLNENLEN